MALGIAAAVVAVPAATLAYGGDGLRDAANAYRQSGGLAPVVGTSLLDDIAAARAEDMARNDSLEHDMGYVRARLDGAGVCWSGYGEIIAWSSGGGDYSYTATVAMWWNSPLHRSIMMKPEFNAAGGGWERTAPGAAYSVMIFATLCDAPAPADPYGTTPFTDIAGSQFRDDIEWLYQSGITAGCSPAAYCPAAVVTRGQVASFLARALDLPATARDYFSDDSGSVHEADINRLAEEGITRGCGPGQFCPNTTLRRDEVAALLVRALSLQDGASLDLFDDDDGSLFERDINRLADAGITAGCGLRRYCPSAELTRGEIAALLHRAFGA